MNKSEEMNQSFDERLDEIFAAYERALIGCESVLAGLRDLVGRLVEIDPDQTLPSVHLSTWIGATPEDIVLELFAKSVQKQMVDESWRKVKKMP